MAARASDITVPRLPAKGAEIMAQRGLTLGALFGAVYGALIAPVAVLISAFASVPAGATEAVHGPLIGPPAIAFYAALFGVVLGAGYGLALGAGIGALDGLILGAITRAAFVPLRHPTFYRWVMRILAALCASVLLGVVFTYIPLVSVGPLPPPWEWLFAVAGPTLAGCLAAWLASGRFAAWYFAAARRAAPIRAPA